MRKNKRMIFAAAAIIFPLLMSGCGYETDAEWDGGLPAVESEQSVPTVSYMTEESTESTSPITFAESKTTKRTAYSETEPELATTTAGTSPKATGDGKISTVSGVPNVPIAEFTSTTPLDLAELGKTDASSSSGAESSYQSSQSGDTDTSASESTADIPSETEGVLSGSKSAGTNLKRPYSYNFIDDKQKYIYDAIVTAAESHSDTVSFSSDMNVTAEEYCEVYQLIYDDEQALFYIDTKMQYVVNSNTRKIASATVFYKYSKSETEKMQAEIDAEVDKILAEITPDMTDYDKAKLFNDVLASTVVYDETASNCRDIYGVFVDKKAICGGYSKAFSYLCAKVGIETATVTGDADGQAHMWNKVRIDGKWYNVDVTYAVASYDGEPYVRYDYFCVTDEMLSSSREIYEQSYEYPEAYDDSLGYFEKNDLVADSLEEVVQILTDELIKASETGSIPVQVKCADENVYEDAVYYLFNSSQKKALEILEDAYSEAYVKYDRSVVNYNQDATSKVIKLFPAYEE